MGKKPQPTPTVHGLNYVSSLSASLLERKVGEEYADGLKSVSGKYNPDLVPPQSPVLAKNVDVTDASFREKLLQWSPFLREHTYNILRQIVRQGWRLVKKGMKIDDLRQAYCNLLLEPPVNIQGISHAISEENMTLEVPALTNNEKIAENPSHFESLFYDPANDIANLYSDLEWDTQLNNGFIDATAKAMVVGSTYLTVFAEELYRPELQNDSDDLVRPVYKVFTQNNVYRMYGDKSRRITEVYFRFPPTANLYYEGDYKNSTNYLDIKNNKRSMFNSANYGMEMVGFLTQYAREDVRPSRLRINQVTIQQTELKKKCILIQPCPTISNPSGYPYLERECQTALEKICLRFYELLYLHKGGVNRFGAMMSGLDSSIKAAFVKNIQRGMLSQGSILEYDAAGKPITDMFQIQETEIPIGPALDTVNSHLSEDAQLTKQGIEGEATSGALGGFAPKQNAETDDSLILDIQEMLVSIIKDINEIFFGLDPLQYDIFFFTPFKTPSIINPSSTEDSNESNDETEDESNESTKEVHGYQWGSQFEAESHSIQNNFVVYEGNMLQAGVYAYPDQPGKPTKFYPSDAIKRMCERDVRTGYLELDHSFNPIETAKSEGVGHFEITGFDTINHKDITKFFIRKEIADKLGSHIKVSPYFYPIKQNGIIQDVFVQNCAIMVKDQARSELTGLKSEAKRK